MSWQGKRVLVTGAGGFIGSHLVEELVKAGASVTAFLRYNSRSGQGNLEYLDPGILDNIGIVFGDIRNFDAVSREVKGCDVVFHLAALVGIPYSYENVREVVETNQLGTLNILTASKEAVGRVVHTSSSEVYGSACYVPIDEKHPLQGQSPYSASKIGAEKLAESFYASFDLPVVTVRPFNCYGPRQSARAVIPAMISQALCHDEILLGNTETLRDFTFVTDTVAGFMAAAESEAAVGKVFNLGSGKEVAIGELARIIGSLTRPDLTIKLDPARLRPSKSEVTRLLSDNSLAKQVLKWEPTITLNDGLARTKEWIAAHLPLYPVGVYQK
ncbi:MAG: SDR family NAD(P)-dependent oxidoreductase [Bacillota bacterium]